MILAVLVLACVAAYHILWPTYSWENYIDPDEVRLATTSYLGETYEVQRDKAPRLLRRLIGALNGGRRSFPQTKVDFDDGVIVVHRSRGSSVLIRYGRTRKDGPILFRDETTGYYGSWTVYRASALSRALQAIRNSKKCQVKRPNIPTRSLSRVVLYAGGSHRTLPGSSPEGRRVLGAVNEFLSSVDTSFYALLGDPTRSSFYLGEVEPHTHLSGTTGALLILDPPLSMHTNMMFWERESGPPAEYHEFKANMILISDALSFKGHRVAAYSSDARRNRFYLFDAGPPASPAQASQIAEKWNRIIRRIEEAVGSLHARTR